MNEEKCSINTGINLFDIINELTPDETDQFLEEEDEFFSTEMQERMNEHSDIFHYWNC